MFPSSTSNHSETTNSQILMQSNDPKCPKGSLGKIIHLEKQTIGYLNDLYAVRLIEKLARPIKIEKKHQLINDVKNRLHVIHERMRKIGEELDTGFLTIQKQPKIGWKEKKIFQMNLHAKLAIFNLRKKYSEVLISSSFVHYKYITKNLQINEPLEMLDIQKWLYSCTQKLEKLSRDQTQSCC